MKNLKKILCNLSLFLITAYPATAFAQVTLSANNQKIKQVIALIEKNSEYSFLYSDDYLDLDKIISVNVKNESIESALNKVFKNTDITYVIIAMDKQILLKSEKNKVISPSKKYSGIVLDEKGEAIIGASVALKGGKTGTATDIDGKFSLEAVPGSTLTVSYVGYTTKEIKLSDNTHLQIEIKEDQVSLDEVVVVAYGSMKKSDLSSSISVLRAEEIAKVPVASIGQAIEGKIAGVTVISNGMPGSGQSSIRIRGVGTINDTEPLTVVDGIPGAPMPDANDIESFQVLKDAAACALYGARGSNGIILITTKKGVKGKTNISYSGFYGWQQLSKKLDLLSSEEYVLFHRENLNINNLGGEYANGWVLLSQRVQQAITDPASMQHTDWQDAIFRTAPTTKHAVSVSGGAENTSYFFSGSYQKQDGIEINTDYEKANFQVNTSAKLGNLTIGENLNLYRTTSTSRSISESAIIQSPLVPIYNSNNLGGYDGPTEVLDILNFQNPIANANLNPSQGEHYVASGNIFVELNFLKDFTYRGNFAAKINNSESYSKSLSAVFGTVSRPYTSMSMAHDNNFYSAVENTLTWQKTLNKHHINAMAGYTREYSRDKYTYESADKFNVRNPVSFGSVATDATRQLDGGFSETAMESILGRIMYDYAGKYLLTVNYRRDGSSKFGKNYKYGNFPSFSAAWRMTEEAFMQNTRSIIDNLKIRASWGVIGSDFGVGSYNELFLASSLKYVYGDAVAPATTFSGLLNEDLRWEEQKTTDIGFDLDLFGGKLSVVADYYYKATDGILISVPVSYSSGLSSMLMNAGNIENKGLELSLIARKNTGDLHLEGTFNFTMERNKVLKLGNLNQPIIGGSGSVFKDGVTLTEVGHTIGQFYGYKMAGIYQIGDTDIPAGLSPGDIRFDDMIDGVPGLTAADRTQIGSPFPDFTYNFGLNADWKGFDFSVFFQGVQGIDVFNVNLYSLEGMKDFRQASVKVKDRWTPQNPSSTMPRASQTTSSHNLRISDRFVEDASFLRFKSITLGYTIPRQYLSKLAILKARVYVSAQNLFVLTKYSGYDPEIAKSSAFNVQESTSPNLYRGIDRDNYPHSQSMFVGLELNF